MFDIGNRGRKRARSSEAASVADISTIYPKAERHAKTFGRKEEKGRNAFGSKWV